MSRMTYAEALTLSSGDQLKLLAMYLSGQRPDGTSITDSDDPGGDIVPITPDDGNDLASPGRGLIVEVTGDVHVTMQSGVERIIPAVFLPEGTAFPVQVTRVWAAGTTAVGIWVLV